MMKGRDRSPFADALGRKPPERMSEFFDFQRWPDKAAMKVNRMELLAIVTMIERGKSEQRWWRRLWRFLKRPAGSGMLNATPPTKGEIARGEATPE